MLFSNPEIAAYLSSTFECAWQSLRPVPRADIDFGNGHKLTRTLNGNIASYFCAPDGRVLDVIPGLVGPAEFLRRAKLAQGLYRQFRRWGAGLVRQYHRRLAVDVAPNGMSAPALRFGLLADASKSGVETRIKDALDPLVAAARQRKDHPGDPVRSDTLYNQRHRYRRVHALLARTPGATPARITGPVFEILGVDLDDPFLGLAPYVLGGEGGRKAGS